MIIVFKPNCPETEIQKVEKMVSDMGYEPRLIKGVEHTVLGAVGDENLHMSLEALKNIPCIEDVHPIQKVQTRKPGNSSGKFHIQNREPGNRREKISDHRRPLRH